MASVPVVPKRCGSSLTMMSGSNLFGCTLRQRNVRSSDKWNPRLNDHWVVQENVRRNSLWKAYPGIGLKPWRRPEARRAYRGPSCFPCCGLGHGQHPHGSTILAPLYPKSAHFGAKTVSGPSTTQARRHCRMVSTATWLQHCYHENTPSLVPALLWADDRSEAHASSASNEARFLASVLATASGAKCRPRRGSA